MLAFFVAVASVASQGLDDIVGVDNQRKFVVRFIGHGCISCHMSAAGIEPTGITRCGLVVNSLVIPLIAIEQSREVKFAVGRRVVRNGRGGTLGNVFALAGTVCNLVLEHPG